jgi:hypothetical protein
VPDAHCPLVGARRGGFLSAAVLLTLSFAKGRRFHRARIACLSLGALELAHEVGERFHSVEADRVV